jgi:large subunit ribosomal protein L24
MAAAKIKKGDQVVVLSGKDRGKTGTVTQSMPKDGKVIVGGLNIATKHRKPSQAEPQGGLVRIEAPLHVSKVAHVTADGKPTRVRFEERDGKKVRVAVKTGDVING